MSFSSHLAVARMLATRRSLGRLVAGALVVGLAWLAMATPAIAADEIVEFRLIPWKTSHFNTTREAEAFLAIMKKLGCETKQEDHDGHIDVRYRCPMWLSLKADSHSAAHKWENWLKARGFETRHEH